MTNELIPEDDHVLRYCTPSKIENGFPLPIAFKLKKNDETYLSVNWVEYYKCENLLSNIQKIREEFNKNHSLSKNGKFVLFQVSKTKESIKETTDQSLCFKKIPYPDSPSHSGIYGYEYNDEVVEDLVRLSKCCKTFPGLF